MDKDKNATNFKVGVMPFEEKEVNPLEVFSQELIMTDYNNSDIDMKKEIFPVFSNWPTKATKADIEKVSYAFSNRSEGCID